MNKNFRDRFFSVNFVGQAGGGKSTLIPIVAEILNKQSKNKDICKIAEGSELKVVAAAVLHPSIFRRAREISKKMEDINSKWKQFIAWIRWIRRLGLRAWHEDKLLLSYQTEICLFDEGIVHYLRKSTRPLPMELLEICHMPHMVVNIYVDKIQAAWRRILRTNHNIRYEILDKHMCRRMAEKRCVNFIRQRGVDEARDFLEKWSTKFCRSPLRDAEIAEIIKKAEQKVSGKDISRAVGPQNNWLRPALESMGVVWIDIDTSDGNPPEKTAGIIAEQIWQQYCKAQQVMGKSAGSRVDAK